MNNLSMLTRPEPTSNVVPIQPWAKSLSQTSDFNRMDNEHERLINDAIRIERAMIENPTRVLTDYVGEAFQRAKSNRMAAGIDTRIYDALRLRKGEYTMQEKALLGGESTCVWYPLVDRQCRTMIAVLRNILTEDAEHPLWALDPTPQPELPPDARMALTNAAMEELELSIAQGLVSTVEDVDLVIDNMRKEYDEEQRLLSRELAKNVENEIRDHLVENNFGRTLDDGLDDFVTFPTAIMRVTDTTSKRISYTAKAKAVSKNVITKGVVNVDPINFYPSADSTTTQNGSFVIEYGRISRGQLAAAKKIKGYVPEAIDKVMMHFENRPREWENDTLDELQGTAQAWREDEFIPVLMYHGRIRGKILKDAKLKAFEGKLLEDNESYECELHVIGNYVIKANWPDDINQERPYHAASVFPLPGSFWGRGVPDILSELSRLAQTCVRSMVRNMGYTSAPITVIDDAMINKKIHGGQGVRGVSPGMVIHTNSMSNPNAGTSRPVDIIQINDHAMEYMRLLEVINEHAENTVGLPRYMLGQPATGGAARTATGFNQLQTNAATVLRSSVVNLDHDWFGPVISQLYRHVISNTDSEHLKADASVRPRGATSLMTREINRDKLQQALGILLPFAKSGHIPTTGVIYLLQEIITELGLDVDRFEFDDALDAVKAAALQQSLAADGSNIAGGAQPGAAAAGGQPLTAPAPQAPQQVQAA